MTWTTIGRLALAHWKESLILLLVTAASILYAQREHALVDRGRALERARVADSTLTANATRLRRVDTLLIRDTLTVRRTIARVDSLRDTLLVHLHDTVLVKEYVSRTDSALKACSELAGDCAEFRRLANIRFAAYEARIAAIPAAVSSRSCTASNIAWSVLGVGGGFYLGRR